MDVALLYSRLYEFVTVMDGFKFELNDVLINYLLVMDEASVVAIVFR